MEWSDLKIEDPNKIYRYLREFIDNLGGFDNDEEAYVFDTTFDPKLSDQFIEHRIVDIIQTLDRINKEDGGKGFKVLEVKEDTDFGCNILDDSFREFKIILKNR